MSYRYEDKIVLSPSEFRVLKANLLNISLKHLHEPRVINSVYFDNLNFDSFNLSEEGVVPRKKIRIRNYPQTKNQHYFLEEKVTSDDGRFKQSKQIDLIKVNKFLNFGYIDQDLGLMKASIGIRYLREYYSFQGLRITFDQNIKYFSYKKKTMFAPELWNIVEIKYKNISDLEKIDHLNTYPKERFSKYCRGIINSKTHINTA